MNKAGTKLSKLDRFLMTVDVLTSNPDLKTIVLDRQWSDHNPILMYNEKSDYGPIPFKLYHSWIHQKGFDVMIKEANEEFVNSNFHSCSLQQKLKFMKLKIKNWHNDSNSRDLERSMEIQSLVNAIELKIDNSTVSDEERNTRLNLLQEQEDLDRYYSMDITQKSKIQWDVKGDENTSFFHGILNQKRRHQLVQGIMVNGEWISNPIQVKKAFFNFFHDKFQPTESSFDANSNPGFTTLCPNIALDLQNPASFEEIRKAVWDCGS
ncbi:hypothetical protein Tco_0190077, partial [Tanacetum coccineum]